MEINSTFNTTTQGEFSSLTISGNGNLVVNAKPTNTAKVTAKMVAEGEVPLGYVLNMPDTLIKELQEMSLILGRDWEKDVESFKKD